MTLGISTYICSWVWFQNVHSLFGTWISDSAFIREEGSSQGYDTGISITYKSARPWNRGQLYSRALHPRLHHQSRRRLSDYERMRSVSSPSRGLRVVDLLKNAVLQGTERNFDPTNSRQFRRRARSLWPSYEYFQSLIKLHTMRLDPIWLHESKWWSRAYDDTRYLIDHWIEGCLSWRMCAMMPL